jgi:hypothetical protein
MGDNCRYKPELYSQLVKLLEIQQFESREIVDKADVLEHLLEHYCKEENSIKE